MRRVSAHELELKYIIKHKIRDFTDAMLEKMFRNLEEKGDSWKRCSTEYLKDKLLEHAQVGNWVSVANYAFILSDNEILEGDVKSNP